MSAKGPTPDAGLPKFVEDLLGEARDKHGLDRELLRDKTLGLLRKRALQVTPKTFAVAFRDVLEKAGQDKAADGLVPLKRKQVVSATPKPAGEEWPIEEGKRVRVTEELVSVIVTRSVGHGKTLDHEIPVIPGYFRPRRKLLVEGAQYYDVEFSKGSRLTGTFDRLYDQLDKIEGRILVRGLGHDVLAQLLYHYCRTAEVGFPTYGVYADGNGNLAEVRVPTPIRETQQEVAEQVARAVIYEPAAKDLADWNKFAGFYDSSEALPILGLAGIAPFALELRRRAVLVPHAFLWSKEHNLGKTKLAYAASSAAFRREAVSAGDLNSEFRFPAHFDAACTPLAVDEAEKFEWDRFGAELKYGAESPNLSSRGTKSLRLERYLSRSVPLFTGNSSGMVSGALLVRFLVDHFEESRAFKRRARSREFDEVYSRLRPVGPAVARAILEAWGSLDALVSEVDERAEEIERLVSSSKFSLQDPRRFRSWGAVYVGLLGWKKLAEKLGSEFRVPPMAEFVRDVIGPVEASTFEGVVSPLEAFRSWWANWKAVNTVRKTEVRIAPGRHGEAHPEFDNVDTIKGEGEIWESSVLEIPGEGEVKHKIAGDWVTRSILDGYNRQAKPDLRFNSLKDLAITALRECSLNPRLAMDPSSDEVMRHKFGEKRDRAAFIPYPTDELDTLRAFVRVSRQAKLNTSTKDNPTRTDACPDVSGGVPTNSAGLDSGQEVAPPDKALSGVSADSGTPPPDHRTRLSPPSYGEAKEIPETGPPRPNGEPKEPATEKAV